MKNFDIHTHYTLDNQLNFDERQKKSEKKDEPDLKLKVDFDELLEKKKELEEKKRLSRKEIQDLLFSFSDEKMKKVFEEIFEAVFRETGYLHEFTEQGLEAQLLDNFSKPHVGSIDIRYNDAETMDDPVRSYAQFNALNRKISVVGNRPHMVNILTEFAEKGSLPYLLDAINHEMVHSQQYPKNLLSTLVFLFRAGKLEPIMEAQAYKAMTISYSRGNIKLFDIIDKGRNLSEEQRDQLLYFLNAFDEMEALGMTHQEIAKIVRSTGKWDGEEKVFPKIEKVIEKLMVDIGLDDRNELGNLVLASRIERGIDKLQAIDIAQEVIKKYSAKIDS